MRSAARAIAWSALCALVPMCALAQEVPPQKYALLIGIDNYQLTAKFGNVPQLAYAKKDADSLKDKLERQGFITVELPNEFATRRAVVTNLFKYQESVREDDTFLLYYAGHGVRREKTGIVYWLNHDGDPTIPDVDGLRISALIELVNEIPARRKLILLDHCYAGQLDDQGITIRKPAGSRATGAGAVPIVNSRDAIPEEVEKTIEGTVSRESRGMVVIAASRGLAFEVNDKKHGVMTSALLSAITTADADRPEPEQPKNGSISAGELMDYVYAKVQDLSKSLSAQQFEQKPVSMIIGSVNQSEMRAWEPLMRNLSGVEVAAAATRFRQQLGRWENQRKISTEVRTDCEAALQRWEQSPSLISPNDEKIITLLREYIDVSRSLEETMRAQAIARGVEQYRGESQ